MTSSLDLLLQQAYSAHTQGQLEQAMLYYRQVLALDPSHAEANYGFGLALYDQAHYPEAYAHFRMAADRNPSYPEAYFGMALAEKALGNYDQAFSHLRRARELRPDYIDAISVEAALLELVGRKQEAFDLLADYVDRGLINTNLAVSFAAVARHVGQQERALAILQRALDVPDLAHAHRRELHFEIGRHLDMMERYDEAFAHFQEANRLKGIVYDPDRQKRLVDEIIHVFGRRGFPEFAHASNTSDLPVFIVGMPRSGTSLVESVLASHPAIFGAGELDFMGLFSRLAPPSLATKRNLFEFMHDLDAASMDRIANEYLALLRQLGGDSVLRVTDKMPYNFFRLGLLTLFFPGARVIHCRRDPRDTCLSIYFQNFTGPHDYAYDLRHIGLYYREYLRLMDHWRGLGTLLPMLEVDYEMLVQSPETQLPRLVEFCGLPWDDACTRFYATDRITKTASYNQVRRPLYRSSVGRWRHYAHHLGDLFQALEMEQSR